MGITPKAKYPLGFLGSWVYNSNGWTRYEDVLGIGPKNLKKKFFPPLSFFGGD